jgi:hypothetical protein
MRPAGIADNRDRRQTLCGLLARPTARMYTPTGHHACRTCARIEQLRPSARPIRLSADLAALRHLIDRAGIEATRTRRANHNQPPRDPATILYELLLAA